MRAGRLIFGIGATCTLLTACVAPPGKLTAFTPPPGPPTVSTAPASQYRQILAEARRSVYRVRSVDCLATGSGFATVDGIVTNRHVAQGSDTLQLSTWSGSDFDASVVAISHGPDLAELTGDRNGLQPAPISNTPASPGTAVWVAGYPEGNQLTVTSGKIVRYVSAKWIGQPEKVLEITNRVEHGNSGGPLFNATGEVVGVVFALQRGTRDALAIPVAYLQSLAQPAADSIDLPCLE